MSLSLKDQLIAAGLVKPTEAKKTEDRQRPAAAAKSNLPNSSAAIAAKFNAYKKPSPEAAKKPVAAARPTEPSLAELYRARELQTQKEQQAAKLAAEAKAKAKRERKLKVSSLISGAALNRKDAEYARHFEYGRKIRRIYLTPEQRELLNAGTLGIVQWEGQFLLLPHALVLSVQEIAPEFVALIGANAETVVASEAELDPNYSDPKFQIPDDLTW